MIKINGKPHYIKAVWLPASVPNPERFGKVETQHGGSVMVVIRTTSFKVYSRKLKAAWKAGGF